MKKRDTHKTLLDWWPIISRYGGLLGVIWSIAIDQMQHPQALVLFGGMMGLDQVVGAQKKRNEVREEDSQSDNL